MSQKQKIKSKPEIAGNESDTPVEMQADTTSEVSEVSEIAGNSETAEPKSTAAVPAKNAPSTHNRCPRCEHVNSDRARLLGKFPPQSYHGVHDGKPYTVIERHRILCEKCRQIHIVRKYR